MQLRSNQSKSHLYNSVTSPINQRFEKSKIYQYRSPHTHKKEKYKITYPYHRINPILNNSQIPTIQKSSKIKAEEDSRRIPKSNAFIIERNENKEMPRQFGKFDPHRDQEERSVKKSATGKNRESRRMLSRGLKVKIGVIPRRDRRNSEAGRSASRQNSPMTCQIARRIVCRNLPATK